MPTWRADPRNGPCFICGTLFIASTALESLAIVPVVFNPGLMRDADKLTPADSSDVADALAFALRFQGRKRVHNADEIMAEIVAQRLVEHLERAGFVVMKRPADVGAGALARGCGD